MKLPEYLKFIPTTLSGIAVVLIGSGITYIPKIGEIAGNAVISAGVMAIVYGITDKFARATHGGDVFKNEKHLMDTMRGWKK